MKKSLLTLLLAATALLPNLTHAQEAAEPSCTYLYADRGAEKLYLDIYNPVAGSETTLDGATKPTIIFAFGGGFKSGSRDEEEYRKWFKMLTNDGYRVVSIDYRLGMKNMKSVGLGNIGEASDAIQMAVVDMITATAFLVGHAGEFGIDPANIVISGSSAGAITSLQADWEVCNREPIAGILPEGFRYAGVMSFAGAIFSWKGRPRYTSKPAPTLMLHGTDDNIVPYRQRAVFSYHFTGTDILTKIFKKHSFTYNTLRFKGHSHEIASTMIHCYDREIEFLENVVMKHDTTPVDELIDDPTIPIPDWAKNARTEDLYK